MALKNVDNFSSLSLIPQGIGQLNCVYLPNLGANTIFFMYIYSVKFIVMRIILNGVLIVLILLVGCVHHTKCPTYANSGTSSGKSKASCPTYSSSTSSSSRISKKKKSCPTYANSGSSTSKTSKKKKSCPTYAQSTASHNKDNKDGVAPWTKKSKEQDKKKATSGLLPNQ